MISGWVTRVEGQILTLEPFCRDYITGLVFSCGCLDVMGNGSVIALSGVPSQAAPGGGDRESPVRRSGVSSSRGRRHCTAATAGHGFISALQG